MHERSSNIEFMRIIAMVMITFNHIWGMSGIESESLDSKSLFTLFYGIGGKVGSNLFLLAGCYFE